MDDLLHQTDQIAHDIDEEAHPSPTGSARALRSYTLGLESSPEDAARLYNEAIRLDPDFGKPYVQLATLALAGGNTTEFNQIFAAARQRSGISPVDRAFLNLLDARQHASLSTRIDALGALVRLMPADPFRLEELGSAELEAGRYTEAADHYRRLGMMLPASTEPLNMLGYALMYAGDEPGATKTFETYQRSAPNDANATDSRGDAAFFFGHFAEAQRFYLQAHQQNPALGEGSELLKAAWARLMQNDPRGAREVVAQYQQERNKVNDPLASLRAAQVLRLTGAGSEAVTLVTPYLQASAPTIRAAAAAQLAWWRFFDHAGPAPDQSSALAQVIAAVAKNDLQAIVPISRKLAESASPGEWWTRILYARVLAGTGQTQEAARYLRFNPIPQPTRGLNLDESWYPWLLSQRKS